MLQRNVAGHIRTYSKPPQPMTAARRARVIEMKTRKFTAKDICVELGMDERTIAKIWADHRKAQVTA